jgi:hypothetical protein
MFRCGLTKLDLDRLNAARGASRIKDTMLSAHHAHRRER